MKNNRYMKEEIEELQRYLLNPVDAVKDNFSYFDSLTHLLEVTEKKNLKIFQLFIAVFKAFLEPYETEEFCHRIPLVNGEPQYKDKILIHKYFYDKKSNEIKINEDTRSEWIRLSIEFNDLKKKNINTEYDLVPKRKYHYYIDNKIGLNVGIFTWKQLHDEGLKTDSEYLQKSYPQNIDKDSDPRFKLWDPRFKLWEEVKLYTNNFKLRPENTFETFSHKPYTPINKLCELFNKKEFSYARGIDLDLNKYLEKLQLKLSIPKQIGTEDDNARITPLKASTTTETQISVEDKSDSPQLGILNPEQTDKLHQICNRTVFNHISLEEFVSSFTNTQDQKLTVKNKNLFLVFVSYWLDIFNEEFIESKTIDSISNITTAYLKKRKITEDTAKTKPQKDFDRKMRDLL